MIRLTLKEEKWLVRRDGGTAEEVDQVFIETPMWAYEGDLVCRGQFDVEQTEDGRVCFIYK